MTFSPSSPPVSPGDAPSLSSSREERMKTTLEAALTPRVLEIRDTSNKHRKHAAARAQGVDQRGPRNSGQTHYEMTIVSERFEALSPLARHRLVHEILAPEFTTGLHALTLTLRSPPKDTPKNDLLETRAAP